MSCSIQPVDAHQRRLSTARVGKKRHLKQKWKLLYFLLYAYRKLQLMVNMRCCCNKTYNAVIIKISAWLKKLKLDISNKAMSLNCVPEAPPLGSVSALINGHIWAAAHHYFRHVLLGYRDEYGLLKTILVTDTRRFLTPSQTHSSVFLSHQNLATPFPVNHLV